jgi:hypothetical protein
MIEMLLSTAPTGWPCPRSEFATMPRGFLFRSPLPAAARVPGGWRKGRERGSPLSFPVGRALAAGLFFLGLSTAPGIGHAATQTAGIGACLVNELAISGARIAIHLPVDSERIQTLQKVADLVDEAAENLQRAHDAAAGVRQGRGGAENLRSSDVRPFLGQECYASHVDRVKQWVLAIDAAMPDTGAFWPTLADGWDEGVTCRAYEKLERGVETIAAWITEIDEKIARLEKQKDGLDRLGKASSRMGEVVLRAAETLMTGGGFGGGLAAWYSVTELTGYGLFFTKDIQTDLSGVEGHIGTRLREARQTRAALVAEQGKLRDSAEVLKLQHGAVDCDRAMEDIVARKRENDRLEIMERMVAAKQAADRRQIDGEAQTRAASDFFGGLLEGFVTGLGMLGGGGLPSYGGGSDPRCAQVQAQIQADRNWLGQVNPNETRQHRSAAGAVVQAHDQNVAWYNQNCR